MELLWLEAVLARVDLWSFQCMLVPLVGEDPLSGIGFRLLRLCGSKKLTHVPILASLLIYDGSALPSSLRQSSSAKWLQFLCIRLYSFALNSALTSFRVSYTLLISFTVPIKYD